MQNENQKKETGTKKLTVEEWAEQGTSERITLAVGEKGDYSVILMEDPRINKLRENATHQARRQRGKTVRICDLNIA